MLTTKDLEPAFRVAVKGRADAVLEIIASPICSAHLQEFVELAVKNPKPAGLKHPLFNRLRELGRFDNRRDWNIYGYGRYPQVNSTRWFWALLLLYIAQVMKPMDEAIVENLSTLATLVFTYGSNLMIAEGLDVLPISAVVLILVLLAARKVKRNHGGFLNSFRARGAFTNSGRLFESQHSPAVKPCLSCAEQLPLAAILCDTCDYNFLAERPGRRQGLLQPPQPMTHASITRHLG